MGTYIVRRILIAIPVLIGITVVSFVALSLAPGDPLLARLWPEQLQEIQRNPKLLEERRKEKWLDQPIPIRYARWLVSAVQGDFGYSIQSRRPIAEEIGKRIPPTLILMGTAMTIAINVGRALRDHLRAAPVLEAGTSRSTASHASGSRRRSSSWASPAI